MAYDRNTEARSANQFGWSGATISLASTDYTVPNTVKGIVVAATGDVVCRPVNGASDITLTAWPAGAMLPWHCTAIRKTGTTATLATVIG